MGSSLLMLQLPTLSWPLGASGSRGMPNRAYYRKGLCVRHRDTPDTSLLLEKVRLAGRWLGPRRSCLQLTSSLVVACHTLSCNPTSGKGDSKTVCFVCGGWGEGADHPLPWTTPQSDRIGGRVGVSP
jgi:hypothetical protein